MRPRAPWGQRQRGQGAPGLWVLAELPCSSLSRDVLWDAGKQKLTGPPLGERTAGPRERRLGHRPGPGLQTAVISVNDRGAEGTLQVGSSRQAQPGDGLLPRAGLTPPWPPGDLLPLLDSGPEAHHPGEAARCMAVGSMPAGGPCYLHGWKAGWCGGGEAEPQHKRPLCELEAPGGDACRPLRGSRGPQGWGTAAGVAPGSPQKPN